MRAESSSSGFRNGLVGVSAMKASQIHFCEKEVINHGKSLSRHYILDIIVEPLSVNLFNGDDWTFQWDSVPAHKAKTILNGGRKRICCWISQKTKIGFPAVHSIINCGQYWKQRYAKTGIPI